jgi:hypothetical protein
MFRNVPKWMAIASLAVPGLIAASPILCLVVPMALEQFYDCRFHHEDSECVVFGEDIGPTLYAFGVTSWIFLFFTVPLGAALYVVVLVCWILAALTRRRAISRAVPSVHDRW